MSSTAHLSRTLHLARSLRPGGSLQAIRSFSTKPTMMSQTLIRPSLGLSSSHIYLRSIPRRLYTSNHEAYAAQASLNMKILYGLIGLNCSIWGYFMYVKALAVDGHMAAIAKFVPNFTLNLQEFSSGRYWQALTSCFMHFSIMHLLFNMISAYSLGEIVARTPGIGPGRFLTVVVGSGLTGSAGYLLNRSSNIEGRFIDYQRGLGFSGCVMGLGAVAAFTNPRITMLLMGVIPMPLWVISLGYLAYDGYYLNDTNSKTAHAGHLGGALFGGVYYFLKLRGIRF